MNEQSMAVGGQESIAPLLEQNRLSDLIQPLVKEIFLFETYVAGTTHLDDPSVLQTIRDGDELTLRREDNPFDGRAILVLTKKGEKLGYVPRRDNVVFSRLMDAGKMLTAKILEIEKLGDYTHINIDIYLLDF